MNLFESVKEAVPMRAAAEHFGIRVGRGGMACCPFHNDRTPSMKLNEDYFYCFGCGATGDVIDFTARLFNLSPKEAADKLAADFGVDCDAGRGGRRPSVRRQLSELQRYQESERRCYRVLCDYLHLLTRWREQYAPGPEDAEWHPLYCEALQKENYIEYLLDEVFLNGDTDEKAGFIREHEKEVLALEQRIQEFGTGHRSEHDHSRRCVAQR
jgi:hypothetical protein